jgi:hypothetical protein
MSNEDSIPESVQIALAESPRWFRRCQRLDHETTLSEQPLSANGFEYFCSDCSRGQYPSLRSTRSLGEKEGTR